MPYVVFFLLGVLGGAGAVFIVMESKRREMLAQLRLQEDEVVRIQELLEDYDNRKRDFDSAVSEFHHRESAFEARIVSYADLKNENQLLKQDLRNFDVQMRKLQFDNAVCTRNQIALDAKIQNLGSRYLKENVKWIGAAIAANNFAGSKQQLQGVIGRCREIGLRVSPEEEAALLAGLRAEFEKAVRAELDREEQTRIKAQIREEQLREREIAREIKRLENEEAAIKAALDRALGEAQHQHSEEVERLKLRLVEAEENAKRAAAQAKQAKGGHIYVLSNIGSFGEGVFKVGMTRRLEPNERIRELGGSAVPFPFDVHMMIASDNAVGLENALHRELHKRRVNRANPRKAFFRVDLETISEIVKANHGSVQYVADPEAIEFRQSQDMSDDDLEFIDHVYESSDDELAALSDEF